MKKIIILILLCTVSISNIFCLFNNDDKDDDDNCDGKSVSIGEKISGSLSSSDPVDDGWFYDTYCIKTKEGKNYKVELWSDSGNTVTLSADTDDGEEDIIYTSDYDYIIETSEGGTATMYIYTNDSNVYSSDVTYSFQISSM